MRAREAGEEVEHLGDVRADVGIRGEDADVRAPKDLLANVVQPFAVLERRFATGFAAPPLQKNAAKFLARSNCARDRIRLVGCMSD